MRRIRAQQMADAAEEAMKPKDVDDGKSEYDVSGFCCVCMMSSL